jgi:hypothetical protein
MFDITIYRTFTFCFPNFKISLYCIACYLLGKDATTNHNIFCNIHVSPYTKIG